LGESPVVRREMDGAATNDAAVVVPAAELGLVLVGLPARAWLVLWIVPERLVGVNEIPKYVVAEVALREPRALLEHDDREAVAGQLARHDAAGRARANNHEIHLVRRRVRAHRRQETGRLVGVMWMPAHSRPRS